MALRRPTSEIDMINNRNTFSPQQDPIHQIIRKGIQLFSASVRLNRSMTRHAYQAHQENRNGITLQGYTCIIPQTPHLYNKLMQKKRHLFVSRLSEW
jgi:hypothetical protein